ncbi:glycosyltransferase involved in cell wall biosynthesis [Pelomonas saccharophila]|uniref:Glycosyltransferase involved in cell wall biosynthesis n=1 Tax=Roseateles saccharophilus TaxID=304 RepID=A0ABU1YTL6_ROSSA|nr:glycosyltransferase family 4 protein [Roseateles saccharophilus]MDR7271550.1 glycosyltransferase involved in cell wall biosynthesis [Roseateles saccharophilus]
MRVAQLNPYLDPLGRPAAQLLRDWPTLGHCARAAAEAGARVAVVQCCAVRDFIRRDGVDYHFLPFDAGDGRPSAGLAELLGRLQPEVMHLQGLGFAREVRWLTSVAPQVPLLLQDHADRPPARPLAWLRWRRAFARARGLMFHAREQALPFVRRGLVTARTRIYEVPESSCDFQPRDRDEARRATGLAGDPCLLWVAHLDANKDPLTVLDGIALAAPRLPGLKLWMCYGKAPLYDAVRERLRDPLLAGRVELLGAVPHARIEMLMSAADAFVQGSHREGSGYSAIEALACGLAPVVTDIPSFRSLLGALPATQAAQLWPTGDAAALAQALVALARTSAAERRAAVRARFDAHCSPAALSRSLAAAYTDALDS